MQTKITKYIRNKKGQPRGVVVAVRNGDEVTYGYSLCHSSKDKWDREKGLQIAEHRALSEKPYLLPKASNTRKVVTDAFQYISNRAVKYFKDLSPEKVAFDSVEGFVNDYTLRQVTL
jgi:ribosomal protein L19